MYYTQENDLARDAKRAELDFASARIVISKVKASYFGGKLPIIRLILLLLGIASFLIPVCTINFAIPFFNPEITVSGLGAYNLYSDNLLLSLPDYATGSMLGSVFKNVIILFAILVVAVLIAVSILVVYLLTWINLKKTSKAMAVLSFITAAVTLSLQIASSAITSSMTSSYIAANSSVGGIISAALFIVLGIINIKFAKKDITLKVHDFDFERKELLKKVKKGEVNLDDLPLPIFETEEEKKERIEALEKALKDEEEGKIND